MKNKFIACVMSPLAGLLCIQAQVRDQPPDGELVELSPFEVRDVADGDFSASEAVTGTRMADKIKDTPFAVNTLTEEFLRDFQLESFDEQLAYVSSFNPEPGEGPYYLRGFRASWALRNGFKRAGLVDDVTVQQIEVIKGPNVSMYGQGKPGGIVNYVTKTARGAPFDRLAMTYYSGGGFNVSVEKNAVLTPKLRHRISARYKDINGTTQWSAQREIPVYATVAWQPGRRTTLTANLEYMGIHTVPEAAVIQYYNRASGRYGGIVYDFYKRNFKSPDAYTDRDRATSDITLNSRLARWLDARLAAGGFYNAQTSVGITGGTSYDPDYAARQLGLVSGNTRVPTRSRSATSYGSLQGDLLANYKIAALPMKTLATADFYRMRAESNEWRSPRQGEWANGTIDTIRYDLPDFDAPGFWTNVNTDTGNRYASDSLMLSQRASLWRRRLTVSGGLRFEHYAQKTRNHRTGAATRYDEDSLTWFTGAVLALSQNLALYGNYSTAVDLQDNLNYIDKNGGALPLVKSSGYEFGVKAALLDNKLTFTLNAYEVVEKDKGRDTGEDDAEGRNIYAPTGEQSARGCELDLQWKAFRGLAVLAAAGWCDTEYTKAPDDPDLQGRQAVRIPRLRASLAARYRISKGLLRGLGFLGAFRYIDEFRYSNTAGNRDFMAPSATLADFGLAYEFRQNLAGGRFAQTLRLTVKNAFDERYVTPSSWGPGRAFLLSWQIKH
ncbi:MAG: TonB-dependent receptor [Opitutaceae bacterium]|jgi:iron complex outermembrane receptor protein|nr:TonB-dependent receptor [Opitutaceae bacterium]